jgi:hypothetical protein
VDAVFAPAPEIRRIAEAMGSDLALEPDWLNDAAKGFMPGPDDAPTTVFESESLLVQAPSAEYLLAMKLFASRGERDLDDAGLLFARLGYASVEEGVGLLTRFYPAARLLPRHRFILEDVVRRAAARSA